LSKKTNISKLPLESDEAYYFAGEEGRLHKCDGELSSCRFCSKLTLDRRRANSYLVLRFSLPVYHPRTRLVNFRLSEEEFQQLKQTCILSGARSVSDYARAAVLALPPQMPSSGCSVRWDRIESLVERLEAGLSQTSPVEVPTRHG